MSLPWIIKQTWKQLLFSHWSAEPNRLAGFLPKELELDTYKGKAWMSAVAFKVCHQRFHGLPELPLLSSYNQLNVRTYVKHGGIPGVYFFTLDANHPPTVLAAKALSLPYRHAKIALINENRNIHFECSRIFSKATFSAKFTAGELAKPVIPGSLDAWLLERYRLFTKWGSFLLVGSISHQSWEVKAAEVTIGENTVLPINDIEDPPLFHYADRKTAFIYPFKKPGN